MNRSGTFTRVIPHFLTLAISAAILIPGGGAVSAQDLASYLEEPYWQQQCDYEIHVTLDREEHTLTGTETISYRNVSPDTLDEFYMHLYPNAYREKDSPLIRDYMQGTLYFFVGLRKSKRGRIDVTGLKVNGEPVDFSVDGTILTSLFPERLPPGGNAKIEIVFEEKIRKKLGRAGYIGNHYQIAQWYPKMVVYDRNGWHPDQFRMGEFYGEFGAFDVHITLPEEFVLAATGVPVSGDPGWEKNKAGRGGGKDRRHGGKARSFPGENAPGLMKTVHFRAENVHDFAWCADPAYVVQDTLYNGYRIMSIYRSWNRAWQDTVLARGLRTMKWLEEIAGPYPYPQVTIVDANIRGGMEYPMLAMNGGTDEGLIIHEVAHNYFYGILANDERAEGWLDEGFVQYLVFRHADEKYGPRGKGDGGHGRHHRRPGSSIWEGISKPVIDLHRRGFAERIATPVHEFRNSYSLWLYTKAPLFLRALRHTVGDETFDEIIRTYVDRWKFKHVDEEAFLTVCEEVSGMDLGEMFKQWLHTTKDCDYRVDRFKVQKTQEGYTADVRIKRKGELMTPLTLAFRLENGNTVSKRLDGMLRTIEASYTFDVKPVSVAINPDNEILDIYRTDNQLPRKRAFALDLPFRDYYPPDAYEFRFLPIGYYNDIDGGKAGLRIRGSYDNYYKRFTLQGLYGFESGRSDLYASYDSPLKYLGRDATVSIEGYHREGRQGTSLTIGKIRRESLNDPLAKHLEFRLVYHDVNDTTYVFPHSYEEGKHIKMGLGLSIYPKTDLFSTSLSFAFDRSIWGSDFSFEKTTFEARAWPARRYPLPVKLYVRLFLGFSSIDPSLQETYNLAGAGSLEKERRFWLRSVGAFPEDYYNNFHVPGDGNLRGYFDGDYSFRRLFASNVELELPFPLPLGRKISRKLDRRLYLFYDWGKVFDKKPLEGLPPSVRGGFDNDFFKEILCDFGAGVRLGPFVAEFPFYISHPQLAGEDEKLDFRWTIGFQGLF